MKKLMIAAAIVCAAAFVQAATATWTMSNVNGPTGVGNSGTAYLFAYTGSGTPTESTVAAAILSAYADGYASKTGADAVSAYLAENSIYDWVGSSGAYGDTTTKPSLTKSKAEGGMGLSAGTTYNFFAVIFDDTTIDDDSMFAVSKALTNKKVPEGESQNLLLSFGTQASYTTADKWQSVPEPTSGLLLLLGVGALALRRRRA